MSSTIAFPLTGLDLQAYVISTGECTYDLFAVSNHYGGLGNGHYTAYAHSPMGGRWMEFNDTSVRPANLSDVCSEAAYLLFYRRRDSEACSIGKMK